ncbi:MAG: FecR domain-containing protein [Elusimicrobia bacterium]|nr:FecR domain-containing protein [Elusimicrobiota bacterium]
MGHLSRRVRSAPHLAVACISLLAAGAAFAAPAAPDPAAPKGDAPAVQAPGEAQPVITSEAVKTRRSKKRPAKKPAAKPKPKPEFEPEPEPPSSAPRRPVVVAEEPYAPAPAAAKKGVPEEPDESAVISAYKGFVEVRPVGKGPWQEVAKPGVELKRGDRVHTYGDSSATAEFHEGSQVEISPYSILSIEKSKFDHIAVGLYQGKVSVKVSWRARRKFEVRAPGAAVVAKASERFSVSATSDRRVRVDVETGEVSVYAVGAKKKLKARERVEVDQGRMGPVDLFGPAPAPEAAAPEAQASPPEDVLETEREEPRGRPPTQEEGARAGPTALPERAQAVRPPSSGEAFKAEVEREVQRALARDASESAVAFGVRTTRYEQGNVLVDATGVRVRVEEYLTRPDPKSFKLITLNERDGNLQYGTLEVSANRVLPLDLSEAGDLFYGPTGFKPQYWAVKYLWTQSNSVDTVSRVGVDGESLAVTLVPTPVFNPSTGRYDAPAVKAAYQTLFGNVYEFINGAADAVQRVYSDPAFRPADNGLLAGTQVSGLLARLQPIEVRISDVAVPATVLATYYDYAYVSLNPADDSGNATGKAGVVSFSVPGSHLGRYLERRWYVNFRDTNRNGILDFAEDTEAGAGCRYGDCSVANVFHNKVSRRDGTVTVDLPGKECQGTDGGCLSNTGDTHFFSDADNDGAIDGGEAAVVGVAGPTDANLLAFAAANPRAWLESDHVATDDYGAPARTASDHPEAGSTAGYNEVADVLESRVFERRMTSSLFGGGKLDLVLNPSPYLWAGLIRPETAGSRCPAAGSGGLVR